jgi:hypothetical protein
MPEVRIILDYSTLGAGGETVQAAGFFKWVWDILKGIAAAVAGSLTDALVSTAKQLASMLTLNNLIGLGVNYAKDQASTWLTKAITDIGHQEWLADFLHAAGLDFEDLMQAGKNALNAGFGVLTTDLTNVLREAKVLDKGAFDLLGLHLSGIKEDLGKSITVASAGTTAALTQHSSILSKAFADWTMFSDQSRAADEEKLRATIAAVFEDRPDRITERARLEAGTQFSELSSTGMDQLESALPGIAATAARILRPIQDRLNDLVLSARSVLYELLIPRLPVSFEHVGVTAVSAFGSAVGLGFAAHGLAAAADLVHPLKATALPQLAAFLADMAGFGVVARETWYEDMRNFLGTPYHHYSLQYFRPTIPPDRELCRLFSEACISEDDFRQGMRYWGYREEWISAYLRDVYRDPSARDLAIMLENPVLRSADVYAILRDGAYSPRSSELFTKGLEKKSLSPYMASYRTALTDLYAEGYISETQLDDQLDPLELGSEAYFLIKKVARFQYIKRYLDDQVKLFSDLCEKGMISDDQFEVSLSALGLPVEKRTLILMSIQAKKRAKVVSEERKEIEKQIRHQQQLVAESYILAYRAGTIDEDGLRSALEFAGYSQELATITAEVERQKRAVTSARRTEASAQRQLSETLRNYEEGYITLYRKGLIDEETLRTYLASLGLAEDYIDSTIELERAKKAKPPAVGMN